eukprot:TRINITY_DN2853_c0_g1_i1.p1 TRINITY_DN2853_c0_g1~~TRINITY_DN2853_c0_g1_i1.p1  ORF type:complete len:239 (-),score=36.06 TRINITY_DN2853_c0_g1_i1:151-867(-)
MEVASVAENANLESKGLNEVSESPEDVARLRQHNQELEEKLRLCELKLAQSASKDRTPESPSLSSPEGKDLFLHQLQQYVESDLFLSALCPTEDHMMLIKDEQARDRVAVIDSEAVDWWTLVPSENQPPQDELLSGSFVIVHESDVVAAVAEYVASVLQTLPETKNLDAREIQSTLATTLHQVRKQGMCHKLWQWGSKVYSYYDWARFAYSIAKQPETVMYVLSALCSILKYCSLLFL